jgi:hypothetical protein
LVRFGFLEQNRFGSAFFGLARFWLSFFGSAWFWHGLAWFFFPVFLVPDLKKTKTKPNRSIFSKF